MAKKTAQIIVALACSDCRRQNYTTTRNKQKDKLKLKKYCPWCKKHTLHKEVKIKKSKK